MKQLKLLQLSSLREKYFFFKAPLFKKSIKIALQSWSKKNKWTKLAEFSCEILKKKTNDWTWNKRWYNKLIIHIIYNIFANFPKFIPSFWSVSMMQNGQQNGIQPIWVQDNEFFKRISVIIRCYTYKTRPIKLTKSLLSPNLLWNVVETPRFLLVYLHLYLHPGPFYLHLYLHPGHYLFASKGDL